MRVIKLNEMAYERADAIERCYNLGKKFAEHFIKVVSKNLTDDDFKHHCVEMQAWYDEVKGLKLKYNGKKLSRGQLYDWFGTLGKNSADVVGESLEELYDIFLMRLFGSDKTIKEVFNEIL